MSKKISQLAFTATIGATDEIEINAGGTNKRIFRDAIFGGPGGITLGVNSGGAFVGVDNADGARMDVAGTNTITMRQNGILLFQLDAAGTLTMNGVNGGQANLAANGGLVNVDGAGNVALIPNAGAIVGIGYTPGFPGDWVVAPTDLLLAVDRIARVVSALGTVPIP